MIHHQHNTNQPLHVASCDSESITKNYSKMASRRLLTQLIRTAPRLAFPQPAAFSPVSARIRRTPFSTTSHRREDIPSASAAASPTPPGYLNDTERRIFDILARDLKPTELEVQDISGGCGSMFALNIVSEQFTGLPVIKQHRLVNQVLGEEIKKWHGVQLRTSAPKAP